MSYLALSPQGGNSYLDRIAKQGDEITASSTFTLFGALYRSLIEEVTSSTPPVVHDKIVDEALRASRSESAKKQPRDSMGRFKKNNK